MTKRKTLIIWLCVIFAVLILRNVIDIANKPDTKVKVIEKKCPECPQCPDTPDPVTGLRPSEKHVPLIKDRAPSFFEMMGYEIEGYEGFINSDVWYLLKRKDSDCPLIWRCYIKYHEGVNELHMYNLEVMNPGIKCDDE